VILPNTKDNNYFFNISFKNTFNLSNKNNNIENQVNYNADNLDHRYFLDDMNKSRMTEIILSNSNNNNKLSSDNNLLVSDK